MKMNERDKLIEAMASRIAVVAAPRWRDIADLALQSIAEQGYAVVPRRPSPSADTMEYAAVIEWDLARPQRENP